MYLSSLQQYILAECCRRREAVDRQRFEEFYVNRQQAPGRQVVKIITKSLERLIGRGILIGFGVKTREKWFIKEVKVTSLGKKLWIEWQQSRQKQLPI